MSTKRDLIIAGLNVQVFLPPSGNSPLVALFLLHGRHGSAKEVESTVQSVIELLQQHDHLQHVVIITFDHRNHGTRLVNIQANNVWSQEKENNNEQHAIDMYSIQTGTTRDISFLIDFLPSFLFPMGERVIAEWGVSGISLGGHSTWLALCQDKRVKFGFPIIGCPDYLTLINHRAKQSGIPLAPPYFPATFTALLRNVDPPSTPYQALDTSNPFLGKKILVLSGKDDTLVPWLASQEFVANLQVGPNGVKKVFVQEGVGHLCTPEMLQNMVEFLVAEVLEKN